MDAPREYNYGFCAIAGRSQTADISKDAAVVVVAPQLGAEWKREVPTIQDSGRRLPNCAQLIE